MNPRFEAVQRATFPVARQTRENLVNFFHGASQVNLKNPKIMLPVFLGGMGALAAPDLLAAIRSDSELTRPASVRSILSFIEPQTAQAVRCVVVLDPIREQFYRELGGAKDSVGRPQFDPGIDQVLGPAFIPGQPKRSLLLNTPNQVPAQDVRLEVDNDGIGRRADSQNPNQRTSQVTLTGNSNAQAKIKVNGQDRTVDGIKVTVQSLVTGYNDEQALACNLPNNQAQPLFVMSWSGQVNNFTGPTVVPQGERWAKIPVPAQTAEELSTQQLPIVTQTPVVGRPATPQPNTPTAVPDRVVTATPAPADGRQPRPGQNRVLGKNCTMLIQSSQPQEICLVF